MNISEHINAIPGIQYYVLLINYGGKIGIGASVAPEYTRRQIVEEVRDVIASPTSRIVHIKHVNGNDMVDVTAEIVRDALDESFNPGLVSLADLQAERWDHDRDLRKHEAVS